MSRLHGSFVPTLASWPLCVPPPPIAHYLQPMSMAGTEEEDPTVMSQHYFATQEL